MSSIFTDRSQRLLNVRQINLHKCKSATALIVNTLHLAQTNKIKQIVLIQEPWIVNKKINGFENVPCNVFYLNKGENPRSCIVTSKDITITLLPQFCDGDTTSVMLNTGSAGSNEDIVFCSAYLPYDGRDSTPGKVVSELTEFCSDSGLSLIIGSDTNAHHTLWGSSNINDRGSKLAEFLACTNLEILNIGTEPTFVTRSRSEVLDVTFSSIDIVDRILNWHVSPEETLSDHKEIVFDIAVPFGSEALFRNPRNTNWSLFNEQLDISLNSIDWNPSITSVDAVDTAVESLTNALHSAFLHACPGRSSKPLKNRWWNNKLSTLRKQCRKLYRSYRFCPPTLKDVRWDEFKAKRNEYNFELKKSKENSWVRYCNEIEGITAMSRVHKLMAKDSLNMPGVLRYSNGDFTKTPEEAAKLLLDTHFPGNSCINSSDTATRFRDLTFRESEINANCITLDRIRWAVKSFKPYKSAGLDEILPVLLQKALHQIENHLLTIFTASLKFGYIPKLWQGVRVVFIPKAGKDDYTLPKSFRPISLTSFLLKTLERLIERHIKDFISENCPISDSQHAFQEGKSTETALHSLINDIEYTLSHKEYAVCTFLDIEGAFDNVSFDAIDKALSFRNVADPIRKWTSHLLCSRAITYEAYGSKTTVNPTRGSPQGGVLSPTFWILVMDELIAALEAEGFTVIGYADDLVIVCRGKFLNSLCESTQRALKIVERWCTKIGLSVNPSKTELVIFTNKRDDTGFKNPKLFGTALERSSSVKYLGLTLTPNLNWKEHIAYRINKSIKVFWCCKRAIGRNWGLSPANLLWLYKAIVRPMISYGSFIWWKGTETVLAKKTLSHLQRIACLAVTGAAKSAPQVALETLLFLPPLDKFIISEAKITSYRLRSLITERCLRVNGHSSILTKLYDHDQELEAMGEKMRPKYYFDKNFSVQYQRNETNEEVLRIFSPNIDHWFTDASVNQHGSGYGIYHLNLDNGYSGYLGKYTSIAQAELVAILNCCLIISHDRISTTPIIIYSDSQVALNALSSHKTDSILVNECLGEIEKITQRRALTLSWIPSHSNIEGNLRADILAKRGAHDIAYGPEPFLPLQEKLCRDACETWLSTELRELWLFAGSQTTKRFVATPNLKLTQHLLGMCKLKLSFTVGMLTGHILLNAHMKRIGLRDDPDCNFCGRGEETSVHFLCNCSFFCNLRRELFGYDFLTPTEVACQHVGKIFSFIKRSKRFRDNRFSPSTVPI